MTEPQSLEEFWPYYVSQHQDPTCRRLHFIGTTLALGCIAVSPVIPQALLAAPVFGYGFAWVGHFAFEKNKPASWGGAKAFYWSLRSDFKMWAHMVAGTMDAEVEKYRPATLAVV
ncbi:MAG: DUF962 domain-containing protein [Kofleriaceae bacterium]|nr:DUF962 domain-containing protein [Kofleriaceae bacterium]